MPKMQMAPLTRPCACGCGEPTSRMFRPGHDARLKGELIRANREHRPANVPFDVFGSLDPQQVAGKLGWDHFLTPAKVRAPRKAANSAKILARVGRWEYEGEIRDGVFHYEDRNGNPLQAEKFEVVK